LWFPRPGLRRHHGYTSGSALVVHDEEQPFNALFTPAMISLTVIVPSPLASPAVQVEAFAVPSAMFTIVMSSFTVTSRSPLQSPRQDPGVRVGVGVIATVAVVVGRPEAAPVGVDVCVGTDVSVGVPVAIAL